MVPKRLFLRILKNLEGLTPSHFTALLQSKSTVAASRSGARNTLIIAMSWQMLVAVGERTREIGLCKAVGAKNSDILLQFLSESVGVCSIGGLLGTGVGIFVGGGISHLAVRIVKIVPTWPAVFSPQ